MANLPVELEAKLHAMEAFAPKDQSIAWTRFQAGKIICARVASTLASVMTSASQVKAPEKRKPMGDQLFQVLDVCMEQYNEANVLVEHLAYLYEHSNKGARDPAAEAYSRRLARRVLLVAGELQAAKDAVKALLQGEAPPASLFSDRPSTLRWDSPTPRGAGGRRRGSTGSSLSTDSSRDEPAGAASMLVSPIRTQTAGAAVPDSNRKEEGKSSTDAAVQQHKEGKQVSTSSVHRTAAVSGPISSPILVHHSSASSTAVPRDGRALSPPRAGAALLTPVPPGKSSTSRNEAAAPKSPQGLPSSAKGKGTPASARAAAERASVEAGEALAKMLEREKAAFADKARSVLQAEIQHARAAAAKAQAEMKVAQELRAMHEESEASVQDLSSQVQALSRQLYATQQEKESLAQQVQALRMQHAQVLASSRPDNSSSTLLQRVREESDATVSALRVALREAQGQADTASMAASRAGVELDRVRAQARVDLEQARAEGSKAVEGLRAQLVSLQSQYAEALADVLRLRDQGKATLASMDAQAYEAQALKVKHVSTEQEMLQLRAQVESLEEALESERVERAVALLECSRLGREGERAAQEAKERLAAVLDELASSKATLNTAQATVRAQEGALRRVHEECDTLRGRAVHAEGQLAAALSSASSLGRSRPEESTSSLRVELAAAQEVAQDSLRSLGEAREREGRLQGEASMLRLRIEELRREKEEAQAVLAELKRQVASAQSSTGSAGSSLTDSSLELRSLLAASQQAQAVAEGRATRLDEEVRAKAETIAQLESESVRARASLQSHAAHVTSLQGRLSHAMAVAGKYEDMLGMMEEQAEAANTAIALLRAQVEATREKVEAADSVVAERAQSAPVPPAPTVQQQQQQEGGYSGDGSTPRPAVYMGGSPSSLPSPDAESPLKIVDAAVAQTGVAMRDLRTVLGVTRKAMEDAQAEARAAREQAVQARLALSASESQVDTLKQQLQAAQVQCAELAQQIGALKGGRAAVSPASPLPATPTPPAGLPPLSPGQTGIVVRSVQSTPGSPQVTSPRSSDSELALKAASDNLRDLKVVLSATRTALNAAQAEAAAAREQAVQARIAQAASEAEVTVLKQQLGSAQARAAERGQEVGALKSELERLKAGKE